MSAYACYPSLQARAVLVTGSASGVGAVGTGPDDIARMALFLGADDSAMCTAQDFIVDGGWV